MPKVYKLIELLFFLFFIALCSTIGYFAGNYVGSILAGCVSTAISALCFILYLNSKDQESRDEIMDKCMKVEHPNLAPGWGCCKCKVYNGIHREECKNCDHISCFVSKERNDDESNN